MDARIRLGRINYLNCLPVYYGIEKGIVPINVDLFHGPPTKLNKMFIDGKLDITPISSIEYARNSEKSLILPNMSISADGRVTSILLISKLPAEKLDGKTLTMTKSSATSVVLLKILLAKYWRVKPRLLTREPDLSSMLTQGDAALLIGDDALRESRNVKEFYVYDLGEVWKNYTGLPMVFALWVIRNSYSADPQGLANVAGAFLKSKAWGVENMETLINEAEQTHHLPRDLISEHFAHIKHQLNDYYQTALLRYYKEAADIDLLKHVPELKIWGDNLVG
ncbi:menaquinone biosynthesis protein [Metallumcola ferriviriculae]|uniref:Chorismate dehydratase n=1 Tax=Metallumcola ferriviriculae TaxID=3039180 RepID=A0AAU0UMG4_9FIRM|nr:menaquinone biosynthesis protein [Desulfitibacteraceae bacterium MK1]